MTKLIGPPAPEPRPVAVPSLDEPAVARIRAHLAERRRGGPGDELDAWLLTAGRAFALPAATLPTGLRWSRHGRVLRWGVCYDNALRYAWDPRFQYAEGWVEMDPSRVPRDVVNMPRFGGHAWLVDRATGRVVDPTWHYRGCLAYFGVVIPDDVLARWIIETGSGWVAIVAAYKAATRGVAR